jgi:hypothetical protein
MFRNRTGVFSFAEIDLMKTRVRGDKLDQSNITERVIFPGLEGLTAWLKRHYSSRS